MFQDLTMSEMMIVDGGSTPRQDDRNVPLNNAITFTLYIMMRFGVSKYEAMRSDYLKYKADYNRKYK